MLSWANSMGTFMTSFSRSISPLGGFGGPEKDRKFWYGLLLYCVISAEVLALPHHLLVFSGTLCVDIEQPFS